MKNSTVATALMFALTLSAASRAFADAPLRAIGYVDAEGKRQHLTLTTLKFLEHSASVPASAWGLNQVAEDLALTPQRLKAAGCVESCLFDWAQGNIAIGDEYIAALKESKEAALQPAQPLEALPAAMDQEDVSELAAQVAAVNKRNEPIRKRNDVIAARNESLSQEFDRTVAYLTAIAEKGKGLSPG